MEKKLTINISARSVLVVFLVVALIYLVNLLTGLVIIFFLAYILAIALKPSVALLKKIKVPRPIGAAIVLGSFGLAFVATFWLVLPILFSQVRSLYEGRFEIMESFQVFTAGLPSGLRANIDGSVEALPQKIGEYVIATDLLGRALGFLSGFGGLILFFVATAYMVIEDSTPMSLIKKYWPKKTAEVAADSLRAFETKLSQWVRGQIILSVAVGLLTYIGLLILGVPYAALLAVIAALTELIPYIGPWIGGFFGVAIAFTVSPLLALWVALLYFGIQQLESAILVPRVMRRAVDLSPVTVIFAITSGVILFGILGAIIAVPVVAGGKAAFDTYLRRASG